MEVHNTVEETVIARVDEFFDTLEKNGKLEDFCICSQCRLGLICYVLNRIPPRYIASNRGASRVKYDIIEDQQNVADITTLLHEGVKRITHNQRAETAHAEAAGGTELLPEKPVFNIPAINGRLFNGNNFEPLADIVVELYSAGELVPMKDRNWQNPYRMVSNTNGNFSFWPAPKEAEGADENKTFEYTLKVEAPGFEPLTHVFMIPLKSETHVVDSFTLRRTFKLPDLYMFPPGDEEDA